MKNTFFALLLLCALNGFSQTSEVIVEEKSSAWVKVTGNTTASATRSAPVSQKRVSPKKPSAPKPKSNEEFNKTNQQVNRFKKKEK